MLGNARKYDNTYSDLGRLTSSDRPDGLSHDRKGLSAYAERRFAHPELTDSPVTSTCRRKIANKTRPGNILTRRTVATARRIPRPEMACGRLGARRAPGRCSQYFRCR